MNRLENHIVKNSTKKQPLVSVIIPNYNHARYLDQRIQTVLNQTYQNFEVIILDDCSADNSLEVIDKYKANPHISQIVVNEKNSGNTFIQWDKGIHLAKGELVWIAESDDYCENNLLEELVKAYYKKRGTVLSYSTLTLVNESGVITSSPRTFKNQFFSSGQYLRRYLSLANFVRNASCAIFSKQAALNAHSNYLMYTGAGDYLFWVEIAKQGRISIVNKGLSYFRRHDGAVTNRKDSDGSNFASEKDILERISSFIRIHSLRKLYIYAYHCRRVRLTTYDSEEIRSRLHSLWEVKKYSGIVPHYILRITDIIRNRYNLYL